MQQTHTATQTATHATKHTSVHTATHITKHTSVHTATHATKHRSVHAATHTATYTATHTATYTATHTVKNGFPDRFLLTPMLHPASQSSDIPVVHPHPPLFFLLNTINCMKQNEAYIWSCVAMEPVCTSWLISTHLLCVAGREVLVQYFLVPAA